MKHYSLLTVGWLLASFTCLAQELKEKINPGISKVTVVPASKMAPVLHKSSTVSSVNPSAATLLDAFVKIETGADDKDHDTHYSFGLFDQNDKPICSFHDDSNTDQYPDYFVTPMLKMHMDNPATLASFANGGRIHINIAPNGNDTWVIGEFSIWLDFLNPKFTAQVNWVAFSLTQDKRDIDLYFTCNGTTFTNR